MTVSQLKSELRNAANAEKAKILAGFFKTGPGQYGEGDKFLGAVVPVQRKIAKRYFAARGPSSIRETLAEVLELLQGEYHEERFTGLLILVEQYRRGGERDKELIFRFYLKHLARIDNWDLVDVTAPIIVGGYLFAHDPSQVFALAQSQNLWSRRVAVLATFAFIRSGRFDETLELAERLLIREQEAHDLMHKAVGWMLREVGNRDRRVLEDFLDRWAGSLPRTALRYAIEKFPEPERQRYLAIGKPSKHPR